MSRSSATTSASNLDSPVDVTATVRNPAGTVLTPSRTHRERLRPDFIELSRSPGNDQSIETLTGGGLIAYGATVDNEQRPSAQFRRRDGYPLAQRPCPREADLTPQTGPDLAALGGEPES
jgi:hypothetical protein